MESHLVASALQALATDLKKNKLLGKIQSLSQHAEHAAANPSSLEHQQQFSNAVDDVRKSLEQAASAPMPISIVKTLERLDLAKSSAPHILTRLNGILSRTPFLLPQAAQDITQFKNKLESDYTDIIAGGLALLKKMNIVPLDMADSLAEIGVLLPTSLTNDDLTTINKNLKGWERVLRDFGEVTSGRPPGEIRVRSVSSGSFELYVQFDLEGAKALAVVVLLVLGTLGAVAKMRSRRKELESEGYPDAMIQMDIKHEQSLTSAMHAEAVEKVMAMQAQRETGARDAELKAAIDLDVKFIAASVNRGVDVQVSPPKISDATPDTATAKSLVSELNRLSAKIDALSLGLPDRREPIAQLPAPELDAK